MVVLYIGFFFFFFFKQKTAYEMRISDWSSDVCSSDLFSRIYLARKWRNEGRTQEAVDLLEDHLSEVESTGYQRLIGEVHSLLAEMKLLLGDTSAARKHAEAAIALNGGLVSSLPLVIAYKTLFDITEPEGAPKAAQAARKSVVVGRSVSVRLDLGG